MSKHISIRVQKKYLEYYEAVVILIKKVTTLNNEFLNKALPNRFDEKFQPYIAPKPQILWQYFIWIEFMLDPYFGTVLLVTR